MNGETKGENLIVLDLGKKKQKQIKQLKKGEGPLAEEVAQAIDAARRNADGTNPGQPIIPVVILYRKQEKAAKGFF